MHKFLKRPHESATQPNTTAKREPLIITCHNVNGFSGHILNQQENLLNFLATHKPDIHCIQEAKMQCQNGPRQTHIFDGYTLGKQNKDQGKKHDLVGAFKRKLDELGYKVIWSLSRDPHQKSFAGTGMLYKKDLKTPMIRYDLRIPGSYDDEQEIPTHHIHGRHIVMEFNEFILLNTYAPNKQTKESGWIRRREWDAELITYVREINQAYVQTKSHPNLKKRNKPLIWVGDLNTTTDDHDMDSPKYYRHDVYKVSPKWENPGNGTEPTEWLDCHWDKGQPGCTIGEQKSFAETRRVGHLIDAFRHLHPINDAVEIVEGREAWTWRGSAGRDGNPNSGRYWKKGMRIDYTLVHESLVDRIRRSEILGHGAMREGFLGSDHCPILLELWPKGSTNSGMTAASKEDDGEKSSSSSSSSNKSDTKKQKTTDGTLGSGSEGNGMVNGHKQFTM